MFKYIGRIIKITAASLLALFVLASFAAFVILAQNDSIGIGLCILIGGPVAAIVVCIMICGFGELVDRSVSIDYSLKQFMRDKEDGSINMKKDTAQPAKEKPSVSDRIQALTKLYDAGLITDEEYQSRMGAIH